jgi:hypothetical protein
MIRRRLLFTLASASLAVLAWPGSEATAQPIRDLRDRDMRDRQRQYEAWREEEWRRRAGRPGWRRAHWQEARERRAWISRHGR